MKLILYPEVPNRKIKMGEIEENWQSAQVDLQCISILGIGSQ